MYIVDKKRYVGEILDIGTWGAVELVKVSLSVHPLIREQVLELSIPCKHYMLN